MRVRTTPTPGAKLASASASGSFASTRARFSGSGCRRREPRSRRQPSCRHRRAMTIARASRLSSRPLGKASSTCAKKAMWRAVRRRPTVKSGAYSAYSSWLANQAKPRQTMSGPMRFVGRRRHSSRPVMHHARPMTRVERGRQRRRVRDVARQDEHRRGGAGGERQGPESESDELQLPRLSSPRGCARQACWRGTSMVWLARTSRHATRPPVRVRTSRGA